MVQLNKDELVGVCFEMERVQNAHAAQRLWPNRWPVLRVPTIHATLENYITYRQHGTSLNKNNVNSGKISLAFSYIVIRGKIKDKKLWFHSTFHSVFCNS